MYLAICKQKLRALQSSGACYLCFSLSKGTSWSNVDITDNWKHQRINWSFGLNGSALGEIIVIYSLWKHIPTAIVFGTWRWITIRYVMTYAQFSSKSPQKSAHDALVVFLKARFAMLLWKFFCHERCFVLKVLVDKLWEYGIFLCIFLRKNSSPLSWYSNT